MAAILAGEPHPARGAVVLNAAAAIVIATGAAPRDAAETARQAIDGGAAKAKVAAWRAAAARARGTA
jgi:anthranilate phosphoribosyltransferase